MHFTLIVHENCNYLQNIDYEISEIVLVTK